MHSQPKRSERLLCLIDGYLGPVHEGREGITGLAPHILNAMVQLDAYPGRWALVAERTRVDGLEVKVGAREQVFSSRGYEIAKLNGKTYARRPHVDGRPLTDFVARRPPRRYEPLPAVQPTGFGWSRAEIDDALATAKAWLFPIEGMQAA